MRYRSRGVANTTDNVYDAVLEIVHPVHSMYAEQRQTAAEQAAVFLDRESAPVGCYRPHPPSPFITIITEAAETDDVR